MGNGFPGTKLILFIINSYFSERYYLLEIRSQIIEAAGK